MANQGSYSPSYSDTPEEKKVAPVHDAETNKKVFNELIAPQIDYIKSLVHYYHNKGTDEGYILSVVLEKLYRYINTYDSSRSLSTWIHICVKRYVFKLNQDFAKETQYRTGVDFDEIVRTSGCSSSSHRGQRQSLMEDIPDEVYSALMQIPEYKLRPFLAYVQGYTIREIADMEYQDGHTPCLAEEVVKGRVFWTRNKLQVLLKDYAKHKRSENTKNIAHG